MKNLKIKIGKPVLTDAHIDNQKDFDSLLNNFEQTKVSKGFKNNWGLDMLCIIGLSGLSYAMYFTGAEKSINAITENSLPKNNIVLQTPLTAENGAKDKNQIALSQSHKVDNFIVSSISKNNVSNNKAVKNNSTPPQIFIDSTKNSIPDATVSIPALQANADSLISKNTYTTTTVDSTKNGPTIISKTHGDSIVKVAEEIVWYGLDFSKAVFIGSFGQGPNLPSATGADMKNKWIPLWNALVQYEKENFNIAKAYNKKNVIVDFASVNAVNKEIDTANCISLNEINVKKAGIVELLNKYTNETKKEGIGLVYLVESFNKWSETGVVYAVFFDIKTKTVLKTNRYEGLAIGWGLKNHWAGVIKNVLKTVEMERIMEERTSKKSKK